MNKNKFFNWLRARDREVLNVEKAFYFYQRTPRKMYIKWLSIDFDQTM